MKDKMEQIKYLDEKLLPIFNIKSIIDYDTKISLSTLKDNPEFLNNINSILPQLKKIYPVKILNLTKSKNIRSTEHAVGILKKILILCGVNYDNISRKYIKLSPINEYLQNYIKMKYSTRSDKLYHKYNHIDHNKILKMIKKYSYSSIIVKFDSLNINCNVGKDVKYINSIRVRYEPDRSNIYLKLDKLINMLSNSPHSILFNSNIIRSDTSQLINNTVIPNSNLNDITIKINPIFAIKEILFDPQFNYSKYIKIFVDIRYCIMTKAYNHENISYKLPYTNMECVNGIIIKNVRPNVIKSFIYNGLKCALISNKINDFEMYDICIHTEYLNFKNYYEFDDINQEYILYSELLGDDVLNIDVSDLNIKYEFNLNINKIIYKVKLRNFIDIDKILKFNIKLTYMYINPNIINDYNIIKCLKMDILKQIM